MIILRLRANANHSRLERFALGRDPRRHQRKLQWRGAQLALTDAKIQCLAFIPVFLADALLPLAIRNKATPAARHTQHPVLTKAELARGFGNLVDACTSGDLVEIDIARALDARVQIH